MKNVGKIFETIIKDSLPDYAMLTRLPDPPQSFTQRSDTKFSRKNPYDYLCFDTVGRTLYCWELKTTSQKYLTYHTSKEDEKEKKSVNIQWHQIEGLTKASKYQNVIAGFLINFRLDNEEQLLYFLNINDFNKMKENTNKKSFNIMDAVLYGAKKIDGFKKRTRWYWNLEDFFKSQTNKYI